MDSAVGRGLFKTLSVPSEVTHNHITIVHNSEQEKVGTVDGQHSGTWSLKHCQCL